MIASAQEFVELRTRNDERATHDEAPESVWLEVIQRYPDFKEWVAHNKSVPASVLDRLARDPDPRVRISVAMRRKCSSETLAQLAADPDETVRAMVARNKKAPPHVLETLRRDPSPLVAEAVGSRSNGC